MKRSPLYKRSFGTPAHGSPVRLFDTQSRKSLWEGTKKFGSKALKVGKFTLGKIAAPYAIGEVLYHMHKNDYNMKDAGKSYLKSYGLDIDEITKDD
tara:strand:+ start:174 stop:461 length:288 start_codon:yes stop_codon:yes gene_type:complete